jgi:hypothetical protein
VVSGVGVCNSCLNILYFSVRFFLIFYFVYICSMVETSK